MASYVRALIPNMRPGPCVSDASQRLQLQIQSHWVFGFKYESEGDTGIQTQRLNCVFNGFVTHSTEFSSLQLYIIHQSVSDPHSPRTDSLGASKWKPFLSPQIQTKMAGGS